MPSKRNPRPPKTPKHGQPTVPQPTNTAVDNPNTSRPSMTSSITSGRSAQSTARSHRDDKRVTRATPKHTQPPTEEDSYYTSPSLKEQIKVMDREFAQATKSITEMSHHSSTSSRVRDNPVHYLFTKLGIDVASAYSVALTYARDIMDYGADDIQELFHRFHKKDLENEQLVISLLKIKTAGHVLNHLLEQGHNSIPNSIIKRVQRHPHNDTALENYVHVITCEKTFPIFRTLFTRQYHQERMAFHTESELRSLHNYPSSIAKSSPPSSVVTPAPRHQSPSARSLQPSKDDRFAFLPKPDFRRHTVDNNPTPTKDNTTCDDDDITQDPPLDDRHYASLNYMRNTRLNSARFAPTPKITPRAVFPHRHQWNGSIEKFEEFQNAVEGHYSQVGAGYLFDDTFQLAYLERNSKCYIDFMEDVTSEAQLKCDVRALYGALQSTCQHGTLRTIMEPYKKQQDGIRAWRGIVAKYKADGNKNVRIHRLELVISNVFTKRYPGGLLAWILAYENAFTELAQLGVMAWIDDDSCKRRLFHNAQNTGIDPTVMETICETKTLQETCNWLRSHAIRRDYAHQLDAVSRSHLAQTPNHNVYTPPSPVPSLGIPDEYDVRVVQMCQMMQMPVDMWKSLPKDTQLWLIKERMRLKKECSSSTKNNSTYKNPTNEKKPYNPTASSPSNTRTMPKQYPSNTANNIVVDTHDSRVSLDTMDAFLAHAMCLDDDSDTASQDDISYSQPIKDNHKTSFNGSTITCRVTVSQDTAHLCLNSIIVKRHQNITILDSGADTTVLGKGWLVETIHPTRKANVQGFDVNLAVKRGLPIVSAVSAVDLPDGRVILLRVAEAIYNSSSDHSLLSEFQIRDHGITADTIARKHGGRQCLGISTTSDSSGLISVEYVPLILSRCLCHFGNRVPTTRELNTLVVHSLTQDQVPWDPASFYDDPSPDFATNRALWIQEDSENLRLNAERLASYKDDLDAGNYNTKTLGSSDDFSHTDTQTHGDSAPLGETVCLNIHADTVLDMDNNQILNDYSSDIIQTSDPHASRLSRALSKKVDLDSLRPYFGWRPVDVIRETLKRTTQLAANVIHYPLRRHLKSRFMQLRHRRLNEIIATDTWFSTYPSLEGFNCAQVFYGCTSRRLDVYGMKHSDGEFPGIYLDFIRQRGIPSALHCDNAKAQQSERVKRIHRDLVIADRHTEPHSPWQNPAERDGVRYLKSHVEILLNRSGCPTNLWFLAAQYLCVIKNVCADELLGFKSPNNVAIGETDDISHLLCFYFYEPVLYHDPVSKFPHSKEQPGYFVGFAENTGDKLTFKILKTDKKTVLYRSVVRSASDDLATRNKRVQFDWPIQEQLDKIDPPITSGDTPRDSDERDRHTGRPPPDRDMHTSTVASRTRSKSKTSPEPHLSLYNAMTQSTTAHVFSTFSIVNYMDNNTFYADVDPVLTESCGKDEKNTYRDTLGNLTNSFDKLRFIQAMDHLSDTDSPENSVWDCSEVVAFRVRQENTPEVKCRWKDLNLSNSWVDFYALALQDPIPILRYIRNKPLIDQKVFQPLLKYCTGDPPNQLARAFKSKTTSTSTKYKFGIQVPLGIKQAYEIDRLNGNTLWADAIKTELNQLNEYQTFRRLKPGEKLPTSYQRIPYHIVFDVKFDLRRKARLVAGGNHTTMEREDIYSGVVSMESMRTGFFLGELNGLSCCAADIGNAYLYSCTREKVYVIAGPEFGSDLEGQTLIIYKALYGLRTSAARFHEHLSEQLILLGFIQSKYDHDLWIKDKVDHYEYLATFVDDILVWSKDPMAIMSELKKVYVLKGVGIPEYYLGGNVEILDEHWASDGVGLALSAKTYIENVVPKFETLFGHEFSKQNTPMLENFHPEIDDSPLCSYDESAKFRSVIGSLNWIITLGRYDVSYATCALSRFNMAPRIGHLAAAKRILGYLKVYKKGRIIFDISYIDHSTYPVEDHPNWGEFYPNASEEIPPNLPIQKGNPVRITAYVDANFAHDLVTRRSVTGILLLLNNTPIRWLCKRQKTVETATYGSELVAARVTTELILETRYMLRSLGVHIDGPALMLGDNMSVILNTTVPSSVLKKKHCAINYHRVREAIAGKILRFAKIPSSENLADVLTKPLGRQQFHCLIRKYLFRVPKTLGTAVGTK